MVGWCDSQGAARCFTGAPIASVVSDPPSRSEAAPFREHAGPCRTRGPGALFLAVLGERRIFLALIFVLYFFLRSQMQALWSGSAPAGAPVVLEASINSLNRARERALIGQCGSAPFCLFDPLAVNVRHRFLRAPDQIARPQWLMGAFCCLVFLFSFSSPVSCWAWKTYGHQGRLLVLAVGPRGQR